MSRHRVVDYLEHMRQAATDACSFVEGMDREAFLEDKRSLQAVILSLNIMGEAATKVMEADEVFVDSHPEIPWRNMRGMRNRMAHGYFDIDLEVVWVTLKTALPQLLASLPQAHHDASARSAGG